MPSRSARLAMCLAASVSLPTIAAAPPAPPQYFVVCASAPNLPTVYFSGIVPAQPTAFQEVRTGFADYLAQHFSYKGAVACAPTNSLANAQKAVESRSTALRNAKKNVVDTGWNEGGGSVAAHIGAALSPAAASVASQASATSAKPAVSVGTAAAAGGRAATGSARSATAGSGAGSGGASGGGGAGTSDLASTLSSIFGTSGGGGCSGGSNGASGGGAGKGDKGKSGSGAPSEAAAGDTGCQSPYAQVSSTLTSLFGGTASSTGGAQNAAGGDPRGGAAPPQQEGLGSAEAQSTKLVVYGCGRHDTQVACVTDLTNENQKDTLVLSDVWKDAFIVDDRGDRHPRSKGFFLNIDGDQRSQLDIGYGKSARFVLLFDVVQSKVQKVALRSVRGGLDVEDISLIASGGGVAAVPAR
jgi:hypothetical protein